MTHERWQLVDLAQQAFPAWRQLEFAQRYEILAQACAALPHTSAQMARWQIDNAQAHIEQTQLLSGATGEQNTLTCHGRGVFLCLTQPDLTGYNVQIGCVGQVFAALIAGNTVIIGGDESQALFSTLIPFLPKGILQSLPSSAIDEIIAHADIAGVALISDDISARQMNADLAQRSGPLCQLISETHITTLPTIAAPDYILRFVTEQTVTTNTAAIGGNAALLSQAHQ